MKDVCYLKWHISFNFKFYLIPFLETDHSSPKFASRPDTAHYNKSLFPNCAPTFCANQTDADTQSKFCWVNYFLYIAYFSFYFFLLPYTKKHIAIIWFKQILIFGFYLITIQSYISICYGKIFL